MSNKEILSVHGGRRPKTRIWHLWREGYYTVIKTDESGSRRTVLEGRFRNHRKALKAAKKLLRAQSQNEHG